MPILVALSPSHSDNASRSLYKINQILYSSLMPSSSSPFSTLAPTRGDSPQTSARKACAILAQTVPSPSLPSPHIPFSTLHPTDSDSLPISLAKLNALLYLQSGGTP